MSRLSELKESYDTLDELLADMGNPGPDQVAFVVLGEDTPDEVTAQEFRRWLEGDTDAS